MAESSNTPRDEDLLTAARLGDGDALDALLRRYQPRVYRFGVKMCGDLEDASDVVQETLLAMAQSVREFRGDASVSTWLYSIARSFCIKKRRRSKFAPTTEDSLDALGPKQLEALADSSRDPEEQAAGGEIGATLDAAITSLDPAQREAWDLLIAGYRAGLPRIKDGVSTRAVFDEALAEVRRQSTSLATPEGMHAAEVLLGAHGTDAWALHGVGLDDAEGAPAVLRAGLVVAYELVFVVDGDGFYLEDMIAVHEGRISDADTRSAIYRAGNSRSHVEAVTREVTDHREHERRLRCCG